MKIGDASICELFVLLFCSEVGRTEVDSSLEARVQQDLLGETAQVKNSSDLMEMDYADGM